MFFTGVCTVVSVTVVILVQKFVRELNEPPIIIERFAQPEVAGVFLMCRLVSSVWSTINVGRRLRV